MKGISNEFDLFHRFTRMYFKGKQEWGQISTKRMCPARLCVDSCFGEIDPSDVYLRYYIKQVLGLIGFDKRGMLKVYRVEYFTSRMESLLLNCRVWKRKHMNLFRFMSLLNWEVTKSSTGDLKDRESERPA